VEDPAVHAAAFGAYWSIWGWAFAAGFVLSIYVHEMGHVWALRRAGLAASAPMFIPFVGAFVRLKEAPRSPIEDARIGLGGPWWGLGAALACLGVYQLTGSPIWAALVHVGAFINLFNLIPVWQLDGGRAFAPLSRPERIALLVLVLAGFAVVRDGLLLFIAAGAAYRVWKNDGPKEGDFRGALAFGFVFTVLTVLMLLPVPGVEAGARVPAVAPAVAP
jgi:Zn-dependent protease